MLTMNLLFANPFFPVQPGVDRMLPPRAGCVTEQRGDPAKPGPGAVQPVLPGRCHIFDPEVAGGPAP